MRVTALFGQTQRAEAADAEIASHQLLLRAGYIRRLGAGIYSYLPLGWRALSQISTILRTEMDAIGAQEVSMPVVQPTDVWRRSGRLDSIDPELVRLHDRHGHDLVLAMTHEEVVADLARSEIGSHRQLPAIVYQIQTKFRDQLRPRGGLIRAREFVMKDSYSFARDQAQLEGQYAAHAEAYRRIFERMALPVSMVGADSGIMGGATSNEFIYRTSVGEDTFASCPNCGHAVNVEAIPVEEGDPCPQCRSGMRLERGVEVGHIFQLGTRYSEALGARFTDERGTVRPVVMGSYGIGVGRLLACVAEEHHDEMGLALPATVAPYAAVLVAVGGGEETTRRSEELYAAMTAAGVEVLFDDRDVRPGVKFADADLRGMPLRITVSPRTLAGGAAELRDRRSGAERMVPLDAVVDAVAKPGCQAA